MTEPPLSGYSGAPEDQQHRQDPRPFALHSLVPVQPHSNLREAAATTFPKLVSTFRKTIGIDGTCAPNATAVPRTASQTDSALANRTIGVPKPAVDPSYAANNYKGYRPTHCGQDTNGHINNIGSPFQVAPTSETSEALARAPYYDPGTARLICAAYSTFVNCLPQKALTEDIQALEPSFTNVAERIHCNSSADIKPNATAQGSEDTIQAPAESAAKDVMRAKMVPQAPDFPEAEFAVTSTLKHRGTVADAHKRLYLAVAITYLASLSFGFSLGYSAPALPNLRKAMAFSTSDSGWFASLLSLGAILGGLTGGRVMSMIGRRGALIVASLWFLGGWFCLVMSTFKGALFTGRVLTGIGAGTAALAVSVFISEISPPEHRGLLNTGSNVVLKSGILFVFALGKFLTFQHLATVCLLPAAVTSVALFWCHESPRWLMKNGHRQGASRALHFYVGPGAEAQLAVLERVASPALDSAATGAFSARDLASPYIYRPVLCVLLALTMQNMSGIGPILAYTHDIFEEAGTTISADNAAIFLAATQVVMVGLTTVLCDRLGRKPLLLISSLGTSASLALLGFSFHLKKTAGTEFTESFGWLPLVALCSYTIVYSVGLGPLPWVLLGEMIPLKVKGFATGICTAMLFGEGFVVIKTYSQIRDAIGTAGTYWMFSTSLALGFILTMIFVPETKGKDLEAIEHLFGKPNSPSSEAFVKGCATKGQ